MLRNNAQRQQLIAAVDNGRKISRTEWQPEPARTLPCVMLAANQWDAGVSFLGESVPAVYCQTVPKPHTDGLHAL